MIRVAIVASTGFRARDLAEMLSEDEGIEVVSADTWRGVTNHPGWETADVLLLAGLKADEVPALDVPVVVLSKGAPDEMPLGDAVRGWLPSDATPEQIAGALAAAASGLTVVTPEQARRWLRPHVASFEEDGPRETLTPRELQVLRMLADGYENKEIGAELRISEHTAKFHVAQILAKLRASGRAEAVAIGIRRGLVPV